MKTTKKLKNFIATRTRIVTTKEIATTERLAENEKTALEILEKDYEYSNPGRLETSKQVLSMTETVEVKEAASLT